jgi:hypothetical protein
LLFLVFFWKGTQNLIAMIFLGADRVSVVIACFCLSPGFVDTNFGRIGASKLTPAEGTKSICHCLFEAPKEPSGSYFSSDVERIPLHTLRNPGVPVFDGVYLLHGTS